jgi:two-component system phosphate regulon sensor histidine kinase PhoR
MIFVAGGIDRGSTVVGLVLDDRAFIQNVLSSKLSEAAGDEFILAVLQRGNGEPVYSTGQVTAEDLKQQKELWLFPDFSVGIRLRGETIDELVRERFFRNMVLIVILDVVLLAGVWVVYRSIRREMELVRMKSDFVSNVSHELRTPLALIRMFGETLEMGRIKGEEKKQEYYSTIVRETGRLTRLVNNILNFSRMEAGKKQYQFRVVDVNDIVRAVLDTYSVHLGHEGFAPVMDLTDDLPPVSADGEALTESIINILDNAVKYSDGEKYLHVRTGVHDGSVFVEVEDRGIGIPPEHQEKIFDTFYRVSTGLVHNVKGSGLGLALVRHIMEAHGGKVTVQSAAGKGSVFRLLLPRAKDRHLTHTSLQ